MSTFSGFMPEFPQIRVDNFQQLQGVPPPLACFLSHVHSDHLAGLESFKSPFVYCSAATRALLPRLERYHDRINFEMGILESRKQHYKHLKNLLKPIPLHTPTRIELSPYNKIQVTLFDANHCTGAVMFLIEGGGRAVLYTGDIRAEPWFVNTLARNPYLIEYASNLKKLDCIYLDTSFTDDMSFPTKAEGLKELLQKVSEYPPNTEFHFAPWTFGYEEVWMALSQSLNSQVHVDNYKLRLYQSLSGEFSRGERISGSYLSQEAPILTGHRVGNTDHPGILTLDTSVRLHSCEIHNKCSHLGDQTVLIRPIATRISSGQEISDIGIDGGGTDLNQRPKLELESDTMIRQLMALFFDQEDSSVISNISRLLLVGLRSTRKALVLNDLNIDCDAENLSLEDLTGILTRSRSVAKQRNDENTTLDKKKDVRLPKVITFPYSRHSSYPELRDLVKLFKPMDVYPCTVNKAEWHEGVGIRALFGDLCCGHIFRHDQEMYAAPLESNEGGTQESLNTASTRGSQTNSDDGGNIQKNVTNVSNIILEAQKTSDPPELTCAGKASSENGIQGGCTVPDVSNMSGTTSTFLELDSDTPYVASPRLTRLPLGSEPRYIRRREGLEECSGSSPKRARVCWDSPYTKQRLFNSNLELPRSENVIAPTKSQAVTGVGRYDVEDDVHRCQACGRKIRRPSDECTGCGVGEPAYHEGIDCTGDEGTDECGIKNPCPKEGDRHPRISNVIEDDKYNFVQSQNTRESKALSRDGVSAYDSTSIEGNEYERNNSIDDLSIHRWGAGSPASGETDYKVMYEQISSAYNRLKQEHHELIDDHEKLRRNLLGSDYNDSDEAQQAVDMEVRDPPLSEAVLPYVQGDSQSSAISDQRLRNRVHAVLAAPDDWHKISLMSTVDNHTEEEPEL